MISLIRGRARRGREGGQKKKTDISLSREKRLAAKGDLFSASLLLFHQGGKTGAKNRDEKDAKRGRRRRRRGRYIFSLLLSPPRGDG